MTVGSGRRRRSGSEPAEQFGMQKENEGSRERSARSMQRVLVFLVLAASSAGLVRAQSASYQPDEKIKQEILQFADEQNHAVTTADMETLKRIFVDDLAYINERGIIRTKPERLEELGSGKRKVSHM